MELGVANFQTHGVCLLDDIYIQYNLKNFRPGATHAIHIHEYGDTRRGCASLGAHYNPFGQKHGYHAGDLIFNFTADSDGAFEYAHPHGLNLVDLFGRSIVIHDGEDDLGLRGRKIYTYKTAAKVQESERTGNAGGRMACAIIARSAKIV
jgi:Cu/Zn superoxide dismutase